MTTMADILGWISEKKEPLQPRSIDEVRFSGYPDHVLKEVIGLGRPLGPIGLVKSAHRQDIGESAMASTMGTVGTTNSSGVQ